MFAHHVELILGLSFHVGLILCLPDLHIQRKGLVFGPDDLLSDGSQIAAQSPYPPDSSIKEKGNNK